MQEKRTFNMLFKASFLKYIYSEFIGWFSVSGAISWGSKVLGLSTLLFLYYCLEDVCKTERLGHFEEILLAKAIKV